MPTSGSSPTGSTAVFSPDLPTLASVGLVCAIHQPNLFPRLSTVAKLAAADVWIVLDDVQFTRRDYQHRVRIARPCEPDSYRWLSVPTHLPYGRATLIKDARLVDPARSLRRVDQQLRQHYGGGPHWPQLHRRLEEVLDLFEGTDRTAVVAEASTQLLLAMLGWKGTIVRSSDFSVRSGRSERLADLCSRVGADAYLCGSGGMSYLAPGPFTTAGVEVVPFAVPEGGVWAGSRHASALGPLVAAGPRVLSARFRSLPGSVARTTVLTGPASVRGRVRSWTA
ncbi:WbqC family protein [Kitasatospora sp. NPDC056138]|uniref:WbqC family protein n=1 Tax=Kitasatospora sp. NPDC056138 TaxID=3345724 RepID=UPI0035D8408B